MRVLLIPPTHKYAIEYPSFLSFSDFPSAFGYLSAALKQAGHEVLGFSPNNIPGYVNAETMLKTELTKKLKETQPELIGLGGLCTDYKFLKDAMAICREVSKAPIVLGGQIVNQDAEDIYNILKPDYAIRGDAEEAIKLLISGAYVPGVINASPILDINQLPFPDYEPFAIQEMMDNYGMATRLLYRYSRINPRVYNIVTARHCPFACLQGDTLIDTLEGFVRIKDLVGRQDVQVLSRNPLTNEVQYAPAQNIRQTRQDTGLVRVTFDDDSFIDCTPDHRFMVFRNGNKFSEKADDKEVEAQYLQEGQSVRAVRYRIHPRFGYVDVEYGRHKRKKQHRLVMEGFLGRSLSSAEVVHHVDHNKLNNSIHNLALTNNHNHCGDFHPEVSERMKVNNPMKKKEVAIRQAATLRETIQSGAFVPYMCTPDGRKNIARIAKERALSDKNPLLMVNRKPAFVNHKVVSVEWLEEKQDVYCMEVPNFDWFYANGVLVHNCSFCTQHQVYQERSIENIMAEIKEAYDKYKFNILLILDELFVVNKQRMRDFCVAVLQGKLQYGWDFDWMFQTHASAKLDYEHLCLAKEAGCVSFSYGLESASPKVLESMNKKIKVEQVIEALDLARQAKVGFSANLIFGDPAETYETIAESLSFWLRYAQDSCIFLSNVSPYPGSQLFSECQKKGMFLDKQAYYENIDKNPVNLTTINDREYAGHNQLIKFLEQSWLFCKTTPMKKLTRLDQRDKYLNYAGGDYYHIETTCPHCEKDIEYVERLGDVSQPFWLGTNCPSCNRKVKIVK